MTHSDFSGFQPLDTVEVAQPAGGTREATFISPRGGYATVKFDDGATAMVAPEDVARNVTAEEEDRADNSASRYEGPST